MTSPPRLLIVDDDASAIQALYKTLEDLGSVHFATSGADALALVEHTPVDLILLDARMPGMDGFVTCRALQRMHPDVPVIFVTASSDFATEIKALESGASDFITKPINPPVVRARVAVHLKLKAQSDLLRGLTTRDPLTGLANRRVLDERLAMEWRRAARQQLTLSLLMIDIDHFKAYNDSYGHLQGDDCLCRVAQTLADNVTRAGDLVARYGGEEFAVLLPGSHRACAMALAEKLRGAVRALAIPHPHCSTGPWVTLSIGVASAQPVLPRHSEDRSDVAQSKALSESGLHLGKDLVDRADQALYAAKTEGRDRVRVSPAV